MKTIIKIFITQSIPLLAVLFISLSAGQLFAQEKEAKISFAELKHDFGKVDEGVDLIYNFMFKNEGSENLIIQKVQASCGCTGVEAGDKTEFRKDESGIIKVSFNTGGKSGVQNKSVTVQSNDPKNSMVVLSFTCDIINKEQVSK